VIHRLSNDLAKLDKIVLGEYYGFVGHLSYAACFIISIIFVYILTEHYYWLTFFLLYLVGIYYTYSKHIKAIKAYRRTEDDIKITINSYFAEVVEGQNIIRAFDRVDDNLAGFLKINRNYSQITMMVDGIDCLIRFLLSFSSTLFISAILIYYFFIEIYSPFEIFLLVNILSLEEYLERVNKNVIEFVVKLKCLSRC
jgi:ABC-type multidrug transport system fused ATPase/permease subunit